MLYMTTSVTILGPLVLLFFIAIVSIGVYVLSLVIKALRKYVNTKDVRDHRDVVRKTLGETLKKQRVENNMSQEFVAELLGVSRQAVSKWENGTSDPSTSNLLALAELFKVPAEELIRPIQEKD
jgi:Predicted transcriptional regulators